MAGGYRALKGGQQRSRTCRALLLLAGALCCLWVLRRDSSAPSLAQVPSADDDDGLGPVIAGIVEEHALKAAGVVYLVCFLIAKTEPPAPKVQASATPLEKRADCTQVFLMSAFLSLLSGIVNAVAIIEMGGTVAHHTGNASHTGRLLGSDGARFFALMVAYLAGAGVQGYCKSDGEAVYAGRYSPGLLGSAVAVAGGALIEWLSGNKLVSLPILSFSQGLQNAITRKCSSLPVCTTHMTGYLTDIGAGVGAWVKGGAQEPLPIRTKFFFLSLSAFMAGGFAAKKMLDTIGVLCALVPAGLMGVTAMGLIPMGAQ